MQYNATERRQNLLIPTSSHSTRPSLGHRPGIHGQHIADNSGTADLHALLHELLKCLLGNTKSCKKRAPDANQAPPGPHHAALPAHAGPTTSRHPVHALQALVAQSLWYPILGPPSRLKFGASIGSCSSSRSICISSSNSSHLQQKGRSMSSIILP